MDNEKFNLLKDIYEQAMEREKTRGDSFGQKASNLVGFLGATVGIFISALLPVLVDDKLIEEVSLSCTSIIIWTLSMVSFGAGIISFIIMVWLWRRMLIPVPYMHPDPSTFLSINDLNIVQDEYINDLKKSLSYNQNRINSLGTQFISLAITIKFIVTFFILSSFFFVVCKLITL